MDVDYFINFNRQAGVNNETKEGGDKVNIVRQKALGNSTNVAELSHGGWFTISNFRGTNAEAEIKVNQIDLTASPAFANVTIEISCQTNDDCRVGNDFLACYESLCRDGTCTQEGCNCNDVCDASEDETTCPSDCSSSKVLETTMEQNNGQVSDFVSSSIELPTSTSTNREVVNRLEICLTL